MTMGRMNNMSKFTDAVEAQARREGLSGSSYISPGITSICEDCRDAYDFCCEHSMQYTLDNNDVDEEGSFSHSSCDLCGSHLSGNRYSAHFFECGDPKKALYHIEVCTDCVLYLANGDEPEEWEE